MGAFHPRFHCAQILCITWDSSPVNDMVADSVGRPKLSLQALEDLRTPSFLLHILKLSGKVWLLKDLDVFRWYLVARYEKEIMFRSASQRHARSRSRHRDHAKPHDAHSPEHPKRNEGIRPLRRDLDVCVLPPSSLASLLLVAMPGAPSGFLFLVVSECSFLFSFFGIGSSFQLMNGPKQP